jgi:Spy/CpxP family protein refolding chaperone
MKNKFFSLALSAIFGLSLALAAPQSQDQSAGPHRADPQHRVQMLAKRLNLTADQQKQLQPIFSDREQQIQTILHDSSLSKEDRIAKIRTVREDSDAKIKGVLTDEQKQTYDQLQQQLRNRANGHRGSRNSAQ